jgi:ubiquinone/menaquinone biosynthesis C-methylase UbiE
MSKQSFTPDFEAIKGRQRATWASGDYAAVGTILTVVSENLCEAADLRPGQRVLDVATGSGNTAIAAARRHCEVVGADYVPALLERARERARAERLPVGFQEGDVENLPFEDESFDVVLSTFGAMFAPNQERTAAELVRVCRHGGSIGMANWTPEGFIGELFKVTGRHVPPPAGLRAPVLWGTETRLRELFAGSVTSLRLARRTFWFKFPSAEDYITFFRTNYGPTLKAFEALDAAGREAYAKDLRELIDRFNRSDDETMMVPSEYLEVVAERR